MRRAPLAKRDKPDRNLFAGIRFVKMERPEFKSEQEEAEWWDSHPEFIAELMRRAQAEGKLTRGVIAANLARAAATKPITLRLEARDIERARVVARRKGLRYQTYLRMIIHQQLAREG